jgi:hypothetical protein
MIDASNDRSKRVTEQTNTRRNVIMAKKVYVDSSLYCERKGGSKVLVRWLEGSTTAIVDTYLFKRCLGFHGRLDDAEVRQFFDKHSQQKELIVRGSFALDELLLTILNLNYMKYPGGIARHEMYLPRLGYSVIVNVTADFGRGVELRDARDSAVERTAVLIEEFAPPACQSQGCVNEWHARKPIAEQCDIGCAQPCHVINVA